MGPAKYGNGTRHVGTSIQKFATHALYLLIFCLLDGVSVELNPLDDGTICRWANIFVFVFVSVCLGVLHITLLFQPSTSSTHPASVPICHARDKLCRHKLRDRDEHHTYNSKYI